jgi:hypothetical protein
MRPRRPRVRVDSTAARAKVDRVERTTANPAVVSGASSDRAGLQGPHRHGHHLEMPIRSNCRPEGLSFHWRRPA